MLLIGEITILFVWWTYRQKIVDNHAEKIESTEDPLAGARWDIKFIYNRVTKSRPLKRWFSEAPERRLQYAMALAVAVDMLAISALIRVYFRGAADSDSASSAWHFQFLETSADVEKLPVWLFPTEVFLFALVVFVVIFSTSAIAAIAAKNMRANARPIVLLKLLRYTEPVFVFFFMTAALDHLIG